MNRKHFLRKVDISPKKSSANIETGKNSPSQGNSLPAPANAIDRLVEREKDWTTWVIDCAHMCGWRGYHARGAWSKDGQRFTTPVEADGEGFPDWVFAKEGCGITIYAELKTARGKATPEQMNWLEILSENPNNRCYIWRPQDREEVMEVFRHAN